MRAGAAALSLLSVPLNVQVLQALAEEPRSLVDLRRVLGSPPQTTMRGHLRLLGETGIVERRRQNDFPGSVDLELGRPGRDLLVVADVLRAWLAAAPDGPLALGSPAAKSTIKALVDGWSTGIVRVLAARPLSLTELSKLIANLSYPSLERRLVAMRMTGQIERCPGDGRGTPYTTTAWLRRAIGPLAAGARWERRNVPQQTSPIGKIDVESAFLLAVPMLRLPVDRSGRCRMAVETRNGGGEQRLAGVVAEVDGGEVVSCVARLEGSADAWASGSAASWLGAVIEADTERLEIGGDCDLALALLDGLHGALFAARQAG